MEHVFGRSTLPGILLFAIIFFAQSTLGQTPVKGKIIDALTSEPIEGASILCNKECKCGCISNAHGEFEMTCRQCNQLTISQVGYHSFSIDIRDNKKIIYLEAKASLLNDVVVTANRGATAKRSESPIAITQLNYKTIQDAKAISMDQLLNKVSGVNMVDLGNEQHQMSIRQPMTTKSLFLYLEDGIPVRTTGLYNHNALIEMNMASIKSIEVIKGPSSSLYGSEAIGGVINVLTLAPTAIPVFKISLQGSNTGYRRAEFQSSFISGKFGMAVSGYYASRNNTVMEYSDFNKKNITIRADYSFSGKTKLINSLSYIDYYSDMPGGVDSAMFVSRKFINPQTFTYRLVKALRNHLSLKHQWNVNSNSSATIILRKNEIGQNPAYRIKDDYRRVNGVWRGDKTLAHGEINASSFKSLAFLLQHKQNFSWKKTVITSGMSVDISPSMYKADYIRITKDTIARKYANYIDADSSLTDYSTNINNYAAYINAELEFTSKLKAVASLRYDLFTYKFDNSLVPSAFSGSADTTNSFSRISSKAGLTYNINRSFGMYANYSEGFVPPQVTEMYTGVKVPSLKSSVFYNYEVGGWFEILKNKLAGDFSLYSLKGTNEVVSVRLDDGSFANQNAGKTRHCGIELGLFATLSKSISIRFTGAYSEHEFIDFIEKGTSFNGNKMNNAPNMVFNSELWIKPEFIKGFRIGAEVQKVGKYFTDPQNTYTYNGYCILNLRTAYKKGSFEIWLNALNLTDEYYSNITTKSSYGYSYRLADPGNFNVGCSIDIASLLIKK